MPKHIRAPLKIMFFSRLDFIAYGIFALLILTIFLLYFQHLTTFALTSKQFVPTEGYPALLLNNAYQGTEFHLFWLALLLLESFIIWKLIRLAKHISKRARFAYAFLMQGIALISLLVIALAPVAAVLSLQHKANKEIASAITILNNPAERDKHGILSSTDAIAQHIPQADFTHFSIREIYPQQSALMAFLSPEQDKETFYKAIVVPYAIAHHPHLYDLRFTLLLFPNNILVVHKVNEQDIEHLLPVLAQKMLRAHFGTYISDRYPHTVLLNANDYIVHQKRQEERIRKEHQEYISYLTDYLNDADKIIADNQHIIDTYPQNKEKAQKAYDDYVSKWSGWYDLCKAQKHDDEICDKGKATYDASVQRLQDALQTIDENVKKSEKNITLTTQYKKTAIDKLAIAKQNYQEMLKNPITPELQQGVFNSPDQVAIRYDETGERKFTEYVAITLHEYLHYYSFHPATQIETFLDEGLTEYFKSEVIKQYTEPELLTQSYPEEVKIVEQIAKYIPHDRIVQFYFGQDQSTFAKAFAAVYGTSNYQAFLMQGKDLFYTPQSDKKAKEQYLKDILRLLEK